ncbi:uncharacterized protein LOC123305534 isoform X2 [Chrysoperla carnea]|uniref:uncharacterized protein LOC123305534 isoform X2 n=1 Tax=Chrysoperla carnea TaxID=189513 RepID=UPI001D076894|nr:uncharacterized protein LOC123305534 isoform X2 [Chrysoperla carnea]
MNMSAWSNAEIFEFIDLYKQEPCIWNPYHENNKKRDKIYEAWSRIANAIDIPVSELKKKKESLMSQFRRIKNLKNKSIIEHENGGEIYKPTWIFYEPLESFLKDVYECKDFQTDEDAVITQFDSEGSVDEEHETKINSTRQKRHYAKAPKFEEVNTPVNSNGAFSDAEHESKVNIARLKRLYATPSEPQKARNSPQILEVHSESNLNSALSALNATLHTMQNKYETEDECDLYGSLLAKKLKRFSETERQELMYEIDGLLLQKHHAKS